MKRKQLWSLLGAALPLVLAAVLVFGWQMPRGSGSTGAALSG